MFAALEVATGKVTDQCYDRHGKAEFLDFLKKVAKAYPRRELHVVLDNYHTHMHDDINRWLTKNPRITLHFTPTSGSWLILVEVFFGIITRQAIRRGSFDSVRQLVAAIRAFIEGWNDRCHPFIWTKTADEICPTPPVNEIQTHDTRRAVEPSPSGEEAGHVGIECGAGSGDGGCRMDPGKVMNLVWVSIGAGLLGEPVSLPVSRAGIAALEKMLAAHAGERVVAIEATGSLHRAWAAELERQHPARSACSLPRKPGPRTQRGSARFKTDDRDCAALTYLARQGAGRPQSEEAVVEELRAAVRHRRGLVADRKKAQQRLHDQLNALCPGLSAPAGHGRSLPIETPIGQAVLACAVAFAGRAPSTRSLIARSPGKLTKATAEYWSNRWRDCLPPPPDADGRAERLGRDLGRYHSLLVDVAAVEDEIEVMLARTDGQVLTTLPGVATTRARRSPRTVFRSCRSPTPSISTPPPDWHRRPSGSPVDADGDLSAADVPEVPLRAGLREPVSRGQRLDHLAAVLPDPAGGQGAAPDDADEADNPLRISRGGGVERGAAGQGRRGEAVAHQPRAG